MKFKKEIEELEAINVGFDIHLAEEKIDKVIRLIDLVEVELSDDSKIEKEDIIQVLQNAFGTIYEIGNTKQSLLSGRDFIVAERILPIARSVYGKTKELLPYLYLNLHSSIGNPTIHRQLQEEISEIEMKKTI